MIEVLPTPWSPKNTNLYFAKGDMLGAGAPAPAVALGSGAAGFSPFATADAIFSISWPDISLKIEEGENTQL